MGTPMIQLITAIIRASGMRHRQVSDADRLEPIPEPLVPRPAGLGVLVCLIR